MLSSLFNIIRSIFSFFPSWLLGLIVVLILFIDALFIWRLIK